MKCDAESAENCENVNYGAPPSFSLSAASHNGVVENEVDNFNDGESTASDQQTKVSTDVTCSQ